MKRRVKPFTELSRWQRNRRLRQSIDELTSCKNYNFEKEINMDKISNEKRIIEKCLMENSFIHSQVTGLVTC